MPRIANRAAAAIRQESAPLILRMERMPTPIGTMVILTDEQERLRSLDWEDHEQRMQKLLRLHYGVGAIELAMRPSMSDVRCSLEAYFSGELAAIERLAVQTGGTSFQRSVWQALREIPAGRTLSYGALAAKIGKPAAVRAVGLANGSNPIGIVVPCHRVIGADASLTGYGGGLERKRWLLNHERALPQNLDLDCF